MENQIETLADISLPWIEWISPYIWLQAALIVVLGLILALIAEHLIVATLEKLVARTSSALDDEVISALKRPLFVSIFFISLALATFRLNFPVPLIDVTLASLTTIAVLVWLGFFIRLTRVVLTVLSRAKGRYEFVQPSTLPLFDNSAKLLLFLSALYFIFLAFGLLI